MKKIAFSDKYGLTDAVIQGHKTMTRRIINGDYVEIKTYNANGDWHFIADTNDGDSIELKPNYQIGEEVAVAQRYKDCGWDPDTLQETFVTKPTVFPDLDPFDELSGWIDLPLKYHKGWTNKMFVIANLMPYNIIIAGVNVERLQDISDEDVLREGIWQHPVGEDLYTFDGWEKRLKGIPYPVETYASHPRKAFAALIDRICGRGTWERNPWTFAYSFKVKRASGF